MKLYVAGPMTGVPLLNHPEFDRVSSILRDLGHEVISPAEKDREWGLDPASGVNSLDMGEVMRWDLQQVLACHGIVLLDGWERSSGARLERVVAESAGLGIYRLRFVDRAFGLELAEAGEWDHELIYKAGKAARKNRDPFTNAA